MSFNLKIEPGEYYRNILGHTVLIVGTVNPGTKWYDRGYRFIDEGGNYYTANGSVQSKFYRKLDLTTPVSKAEIAVDHAKRIAKRLKRLYKIYKFGMKIKHAYDAVRPYFMTIHVGLVLAQLAMLIAQRRQANA